MNLRQVAVLMGATAAVLAEVRQALVGLERSKHGRAAGALPVMLLVGAGVAIGALVAQPETRRRVGEWLIGKPSPAPESSADSAPEGTTVVVENASARASQPHSYASGPS
jgi:phosphate/sulfate permease